MKTWTTAAIACGLALAATASARTVTFNDNFMAKHKSRISFNTLEPLPKSLLATAHLNEIYSNSVECSYSESKTNSGEVTVMIAIDKCLNKTSIDLIEKWVDEVKESKIKFTDSEGERNLKFDTTLVDGQCAARSEKEKSGREIETASKYSSAEELLADGTNYRLSKAVLPGEVARISAFAKFGRVLTSVDDWDPKTIAVVSFVSNDFSYGYVKQFEQKYHISKTFGFQICEGGVNCEGHFDNCVFLEEAVDLFMYNPFTITHSWSCSKLHGSVPVTLVDEEGKRKCYCSCPAGSKLEDDTYGGKQCVKVHPDVCPCVWADHPFSYDNEEKLEQCLFTDFATKKNLPVPFPTDNYVSDSRTNNMDETELQNGPHIDVIVTKINSNVYDHEVLNNVYGLVHGGEPLPDSLPDQEVDMLNLIGQGELDKKCTSTGNGQPESTHYTWKDYQKNRVSKIDDIALTAYGKYEITVKAVDYLGEPYAAGCVGCIAVVDKYRPKAHDTCPANFCDTSTSLCRSQDKTATAELTTDNVAKANQLVSDFYKFWESSYNDACSNPADRCDDNQFKYKDFFEEDYTNHYKDFIDGKKCFDHDEMTKDFIAKDVPKTNPLVSKDGCTQRENPVPPYQCKRCCEFSSTLKEWWVDYTCHHDFDIAKCEGDADQTCSTSQCLVLLGDTLATVSANIKPAIKEESEKVLQGITSEGYQCVTQVHRALQCSAFGGDDGTCSYEATISDLLDLEVTNNFGSADDTYVFWRYKVQNGDDNWHLYDPKAADAITHSFKTAQTKIILEAWTACGIVRKFYFYVHLHIHSDIQVCEVFEKMWYQTSESRAEIASTLCAFPGSDFAELTFDYQPNVGLQYAKNNLHMHVTGVQCELEFVDKAKVEILNVQGDSPEIIERFAVELQEFTTTAPTTKFKVMCKFTYARYDGSPVTRECDKWFEVEDCTGPYVDAPGGECSWDDCAGQSKPGPGEACGGKVVRSHATAAYVDDLTLDEAECCEGCGIKQECVSIFDLDVPNAIKRCVPPPKTDAYGHTTDAYGQESYGTYAYDTGYYDAAVSLMAKAVGEHPTVAVASALLAASALVAVVALVVVRRRREKESMAVEEDAYYPLLH